MNFLDWSTVIGLVAVAGFLWRLTHTLNRDMRNLERHVTDEMHKLSEKASELGESVAKIEGLCFIPRRVENGQCNYNGRRHKEFCLAESSPNTRI